MADLTSVVDDTNLGENSILGFEDLIALLHDEGNHQSLVTNHSVTINQ